MNRLTEIRKNLVDAGRNPVRRAQVSREQEPPNSDQIGLSRLSIDGDVKDYLIPLIWKMIGDNEYAMSSNYTLRS